MKLKDTTVRTPTRNITRISVATHAQRLDPEMDQSVTSKGSK